MCPELYRKSPCHGGGWASEGMRYLVPLTTLCSVEFFFSLSSLQTFAQARMRKKVLEGEHALRDVMKPKLAR